ncbi:MAG: type II toxin-antitoxin system VapC family toxin [Myxococcota bacterium]|nr:type II toxin-antitoxin system VapC family toxin [Myxococcota bacterium]
MAFLLDTNAISEVLRSRPNAEFSKWLMELPRAEQFTSSVVAGELLYGALRSSKPDRFVQLYEHQVLPRLTVLPFDLDCARVYASVRAELSSKGQPIEDADLMIAATALHHRLTVVTANVRHFGRVPGLRVRTFKPGSQ